MLKRRKDVTRHVRELIIRPSRSNGQPVSESKAASVAVAEIAASKCLDALSKFTWWDDEITFHEEMWFALRMWFVQVIPTSMADLSLPQLSPVEIPQHQHRCILPSH